MEKGMAMNGSRMLRYCAGMLVLGLIGVVLALAAASTSALAQTATQTPAEVSAPTQTSAQAPSHYQPKFAGDPARSDSEAQALGYMRVVLRAQREYKKRHSKFAESLTALAGTASFTKRMSQTTDRGDYTVSFRSHKDGFMLTMTPKQMDAQHRSFYAEDDGVIHGDDQKAADAESPKVK
jgi:hypothetical protein